MPRARFHHAAEGSLMRLSAARTLPNSSSTTGFCRELPSLLWLLSQVLPKSRSTCAAARPARRQGAAAASDQCMWV